MDLEKYVFARKTWSSDSSSSFLQKVMDYIY